MDATEARSRIWLEMDRIKVCMLVTKDGRQFRSRPMTGHFFPSEHEILFVANRDGTADEEIEAMKEVCLTFADPENAIYISVSGTAEVLHDRERLRNIWSSSVDRWFEKGPNDEHALLLRVEPEKAEIWEDVTNRLLAAAMIMKKDDDSVTDLGERKKVRL